MKYLVPFMYGFSTRAKTVHYKISLLAVVVVPILVVVVFCNDDLAYVLPRFALAFVAIYCIYEIGYLFNDTYTVRFESNPTHRLDARERLLVERWANLLISVRHFTAMVCCLLLHSAGVENLLHFVVMLGLLDISFALHNSIRSVANVWTMFLVLTLKYCSIPVLFMPLNDYMVYSAMLIFAMPAIRTIEWASKPIYGLRIFANYDHDKFRVFYYAVLTVVSTWIWYFVDRRFFCMLALAVYLLVFRLACYFSIKTEAIQAVRRFNARVDS